MFLNLKTKGGENKMKEGDRVRVVNPDTSFYGEVGLIVAVDPKYFFHVYIKERKEVYCFTQYDLEKLEKKEE